MVVGCSVSTRLRNTSLKPKPKLKPAAANIRPNKAWPVLRDWWIMQGSHVLIQLGDVAPHFLYSGTRVIQRLWEDMVDEVRDKLHLVCGANVIPDHDDVNSATRLGHAKSAGPQREVIGLGNCKRKRRDKKSIKRQKMLILQMPCPTVTTDP